jgi:recombination protein RecA
MAVKPLSKAILNCFATLDKRYGEKVAMLMGDAGIAVDTISSGRPDLDVALGGGYGSGKIIEIFAESGCGKTGLCLEAIADVQRQGGTAAFIDSEHALNLEYAEQIGVDTDNLIISQPSYGEQAIETVRAFIATQEIDLIVIDSVAAMIPKAELDGESGEAKMGLQARMMGQAMKMISGSASTVGCTLIFTNQLRDTMSMYGPPQTTPGGKALKFYATQRLEIKNKGQLKEGEDVIGFKQQITVVKNKVAAPFKVILNEIVYGVGVDTLTGLMEALIFNEIIEKKGAWFAYQGTNLANGIKKLRILLNENPELVEELQLKLKEVTS